MAVVSWKRQGKRLWKNKRGLFAVGDDEVRKRWPERREGETQNRTKIDRDSLFFDIGSIEEIKYYFGCGGRGSQ